MTLVTLRLPESAFHSLYESDAVSDAGYRVHSTFDGTQMPKDTGWVSFRVECPKAPLDTLALVKTLGRLAGWKSKHL